MVAMMDQINGHFHSDSVSNINTIVYHGRALRQPLFVSISSRDAAEVASLFKQYLLGRVKRFCIFYAHDTRGDTNQRGYVALIDKYYLYAKKSVSALFPTLQSRLGSSFLREYFFAPISRTSVL